MNAVIFLDEQYRVLTVVAAIIPLACFVGDSPSHFARWSKQDDFLAAATIGLVELDAFHNHLLYAPVRAHEETTNRFL